MNLGQLSTTVGQRLGTDCSSASTRDGAAARQFLIYRHEQLCRAFLWKDLLIAAQFPLNQQYTPLSNYMPTKNRLVLPSIFQNVLGVRIGHHALDVIRPMLFYRADYSAFMKMKYAVEFFLLGACAWEFDTVQSIMANGSNLNDANMAFSTDTLNSDEISVKRSVWSFVPQGMSLLTTDRIDNVLKASGSQGSLSVDILTMGAGIVNTAGITYQGSPQPVATVNVNQGSQYTILPGVNEAGIILVNGNQTVTLQTGVQISVTAQGNQFLFKYPQVVPANAMYGGGASYALNGLFPTLNYNILWGANDVSVTTPNGTINSPGIGQVSNVTGAFLEGTEAILGGNADNVAVTAQWFVSAGAAFTGTINLLYPIGGATVVTLQSADYEAAKCQRVQLVGKPNTRQSDKPLWVLGKRSVPPFAADTDIPAVNGMDGILVALAYYDFKQRLNEGGSSDATTALNEAVGPNFLNPPPGQMSKPGGWLGKLIEEEVVQAAYNTRIIPESGFGDQDYDFPISNKYDIYAQ